MRNIIALLLILFCEGIYGQQYYKDLYGFRLGQYRETLTNEFGKPFAKDKFADGFEYEQFLLKPDSSLYLVCEYAVNQTDIIWSIQISGTDSTVDIGFQGLKLGIAKDLVLKQFGKPTNKEDIGMYGQRWDYEKSNFSFEIDKNSRLSSVKIRDISSEIFGSPDLKKIPAFTQLITILSLDDNSRIAEILAPDIEIRNNDKITYFTKSFKSELTNDYSNVYKMTKELSKDLKTVDINNPDEYEENMRLQFGQDTKHVFKIKKGHQIKEIVLKYYCGKYVIWEINI